MIAAVCTFSCPPFSCQYTCANTGKSILHGQEHVPAPRATVAIWPWFPPPICARALMVLLLLAGALFAAGSGGVEEEERDEAMAGEDCADGR